MRLWTMHPKYLDQKGLVAVWREALLAQKVLRGRTRGYRRHPQLLRFRQHASPVAAIATYLAEIHREARRRGYRFNPKKIAGARTRRALSVTNGQLLYEWLHLRRKLRARDRARYAATTGVTDPDLHPLFRLVEGDIEPWERT